MRVTFFTPTDRVEEDLGKCGSLSSDLDAPGPRAAESLCMHVFVGFMRIKVRSSKDGR